MQPSGSYRYNSLEYILLHDEKLRQQLIGMEGLHVVHRLDRYDSIVIKLLSNLSFFLE